MAQAESKESKKINSAEERPVPKLRWDDSIESLQIAIDIMENPGPEDLYYLAYAQYQAELNYETSQTLNRLRGINPSHAAAQSLENSLAKRYQDLTGDVMKASATQRMSPIPPPGWENLNGTARVSDR